jgi:hypothetical protein
MTSLEDNLRQSLKLPEEAIRWLLDLWDVIQAWDDVVDGHAIERAALDRAIWLSMYGLPANVFFDRHRYALLPVMANAVLKWKASDTIERERLAEHYQKAYMLRAGYYDVVLHVLAIVHGDAEAMKSAHIVPSLYGETYEDYVKECHNA